MATSWYADLEWWIAVLKVAFGLGMVIFVHELGHFAVAKLCGVKCEKFYLGFDIAGLKFCKFTWGETEYGIGILPLGGYVKMLGQEDNPARLREEIERAKQQQPDDQSPKSEQPQPEKVDVEAAQRALFDPRSYLAQSVPKRMAIISAGVIMNLIFAFVMAAVAFQMGVEQMVCGVGQRMPGQAAWQANLEVGDEIVQVGERKTRKFRDMQEAVSLGDIQDGLKIKIRRPGEEEPRTLTVKPDSSGLIPMIGITNPLRTSLAKEGPVAWPGTVAANSAAEIKPGDRIVEIAAIGDDGTMGEHVQIDNYRQIHASLARYPDKKLQFTLERAGAGEQITIEVSPNPMRRLGLVMQMGQIVAVQADSPAQAAGIKPGERITRIDGRPPGDPMTLPDRLRRRAGETITLSIQRKDEEEEAEVSLTLRRPNAFDAPIGKSDPVSAPALGIAYRVLNHVESVIEGSPAAKAGIQAGDEIAELRIIPPDEEVYGDLPISSKELALTFDEQNRDWPASFDVLQKLLPGTDKELTKWEVELTWTRSKKEHQARLKPILSQDWFNPDRGFILEPLTYVQQGATFGESVRLGADETIHSTQLVYRFLQKLGTQQVSPKALGGPVSIFLVAKRAAEQNTSKLLIFLTLLSANLAVLNFLPIPLLDGGHMVFLVWEGIRGKPADERVQLVLTYIGLIFILSLMVWVFGLDFGLISRH